MGAAMAELLETAGFVVAMLLLATVGACFVMARGLVAIGGLALHELGKRWPNTPRS